MAIASFLASLNGGDGVANGGDGIANGGDGIANGGDGLIAASGFVGSQVSPFTSGALISSRDGIVGTRVPTHAVPADHPGDEDALAQWSMRVRANIFAFELLTQFGFAQNGRTMTLRAREDSGTLDNLLTLTAPTPTTMHKSQLGLVFNYADLRSDRSAEILSQLSAIELFYGGITFLHRERSRWTLELLNVLHLATIILEQRVKHAINYPRPSEFSAQINPMIALPGHGSLPSGHAVEAFMMAHILSELTADHDRALYGDQRVMRQQLMRQAHRIAVNRVVAGVHFPIDNIAGQVLGTVLGQYFVGLCKGGSSVTGWEFDLEMHCDSDPVGGQDHDWQAIDDYLTGQGALKPTLKKNGQIARQTTSAELAWLWKKAQSEWRSSVTMTPVPAPPSA